MFLSFILISYSLRVSVNALFFQCTELIKWVHKLSAVKVMDSYCKQGTIFS